MGHTRTVGSSRQHMIVKGRVQGVGFRWSCRAQAVKLGLAGWVRNLPDGTVEVVVEGDDQTVQQLVAWCRNGPAHAQVSGIEIRPESPHGVSDFVIR